LAFLISRSIHEKGYPGKGNIFAKVITDSRINSLTQSLLNFETIAIQSKVIKEFKFK